MIAIIPARGGSKGLPNKNIRILNGKPLIAHTIESALKSKYIDRVIISTDSEEIANIASSYGAEVPFMRPKNLATDTASAVDVYLYTIEIIQKQYKNKLQNFIILLPTSPLRDANDIDKAVEIFQEKKAKTLVSVSELHSPVEWLLEQKENGTVVNAGLGKHANMQNRQKYQCYYEPNGAIYILNYDFLKEHRTYYSDDTIPYIMESLKSVDIDTLDDFELVQAIMKMKDLNRID